MGQFAGVADEHSAKYVSSMSDSRDSRGDSMDVKTVTDGTFPNSSSATNEKLVCVESVLKEKN